MEDPQEPNAETETETPPKGANDDKDTGPINEPGSGGKLKDPRGPGNIGRA